MRIDFPKEVIEELYLKHSSKKKVALHLGVNEKTIARLMKEKNITNVGSQGARKHKFNESYFEEIDTEDKAYWLGFIAADGCVYKGSDGKSNRLQINLKGADIGVLRDFQRAIGSQYKITEKKIGNSDVCQLKVNSSKMCSDLMKLGIVYRKSLVVEFPNIDNKLERHFLRGYFDGDGYVGKTKNGYKFSIVGGFQMLASIRECLLKSGIKINLRNVRDDIYEVDVCNIENLSKLYDFLYKDSSVFLKRKYDVFMERASNLSPSGVILSTKCGSIAGKA